MLPEFNPKTGHPIGCTCDACKDYLMAHPSDFVGQRADKLMIRDVIDPEDVDDDSEVIMKQGVAREVRRYTMTCPLDGCDGVGYYDNIKQVICDDCGCVISGDTQPVIPTEFGEEGDGMGQSRGVEKMPGTRNSYGTYEPSV